MPGDARPRVLAARGLARGGDARRSLGDYLSRLRDAGPRHRCRARPPRSSTTRCARCICPDKVTTAQWLEVIETAHRVGPSLDDHDHVRPRRRGRGTGRATCCGSASCSGEPAASPSSCRCRSCTWRRRCTSRVARARGRPSARRSCMHAVARLALTRWITNIQASWVKLGVDGAQAALRAGANDLGGTLMNESISRAAGAVHGQEMPPERMEEAIRAIGRTPRQRTTLYGESATRASAPLVRRGAAERAAQPERERRRPRCAPETRPARFRRRRALDEPAAGGSRECRVRSLRRSDDRRRSRPVGPDPLGSRRSVDRSARHGRGADRNRRRSRPGDDGALCAPGTRHTRSLRRAGPLRCPRLVPGRAEPDVCRRAGPDRRASATSRPRGAPRSGPAPRRSSSSCSSSSTRSPSSTSASAPSTTTTGAASAAGYPGPSPSRNQARRSHRPARCSARRRERTPHPPGLRPAPESCLREPGRPSMAPCPRCRRRP